MKKLKAIFLIRIIAIVITFNFVFVLLPGKISAQQNDIDFQEFYDQLNPYGQWVEDYNYGYVWIPTAGPTFTPYLSNGYWVMTDYGWMWVSDYDWGWATFHYGRWDYNGSYGWFWVPDNEWGPSWVTWRRSEGYYGWAPMRPGVSISISFGNYNDVPNDRWIFVRDRDIERHDISRNYVDRRNNLTIINNSTVINKTYYDDKRHTTYVAGPGREDVQKITGRTIKPFTVREKDKPGQSLNNDQLQIYRPQVQKHSRMNKPAPSELTNLKNVKKISERNTEKQPSNMQSRNNQTRSVQQQPSVNPVKNIEDKRNNYQQQRLDLSKKENNKDQSPQLRNTNPINDNNIKNSASQKRNLDHPKTENKIDRTLQPKNTIVPKDNNGADQPPKARNINPPKNNNLDQPSKSKTKDDKKENRKLQ